MSDLEIKLEKWQESILDDVQKFAAATEINFRRLYAEGLKKQPVPGAFVLDTFFDGLMGITVHLICSYVSSSKGAEEAAIVAMRRKFDTYRTEKIRKTLMAGPGSAPIPIRQQ